MDPRPSPATILAAIQDLRRQEQGLEALARALEGGTVAELDKAVARARAAGSPEQLVAPADAWLVAERSSRAARLAEGLRQASVAADVHLLVLTRDPLELRLPPVSVRVDVERDRAEVRFADHTLERCRADVAEILEARARAVALLEGDGWDPGTFHDVLRRAWQRVAPSGDWADLVEVYPEVAWLLQPARLRSDCEAAHFLSYPRACFAYDLWRLRRDGALSRGGVRLTVAPATGGSTRDKRRVFRLEDDRGQGQYHLALRFVPDAP